VGLGWKKAIGAAVRHRRLQAGISQQELAFLVGVTQPTISRLETGTLRGARWETITRVVGVLRVGLELTINGAPPPPKRRLPGQRSPES
jgi:transcriptional regulator with XRE-family HTH domain